MRKSPRLLLLGLSFVLMMAALCFIFLYAPTEETMGIIQKIFYIHVPASWLAFLAFFVIFLGSILYLWKGENKWDSIAHSSAEIGFIFISLALITGSIWAKAAWGVWWTWDARLTATLVLWFIYLAYFIVRLSATDELRAARFAAITAIVGFVDVPISALTIILWRTHHPEPLIFKGGLTPPMLVMLLISLAAFTALYFLLLSLRASLRNDERESRKVKKLQD